MNSNPYIIDNPGANDFRLNRETLIDPDILIAERERVFDMIPKCPSRAISLRVTSAGGR